SRGDAATRLGQRNLLHASFPTIPKTSNRGEPNSSKYLAAEEAFLEARDVLEFRDSDSVQFDGVWVQDIQQMLASEPDPEWSVWPAWEDPGTRPQPLQATLRHIEISEFVAAARNEGTQVQMSHSQRLQTQRNRASTAPRYVRPASARGGRTTMPGKSALWPNERMPSSYKAPLKHVLLVSCRPDEKPWAESKPRPSRFMRRHFVSAGGPSVSAVGQRRNDARRTAWRREAKPMRHGDLDLSCLAWKPPPTKDPPQAVAKLHEAEAPLRPRTPQRPWTGGERAGRRPPSRQGPG
ncbi:KCNJ5, partial [Symbiodinium sp. CCMP2456]